MTNRIIDERDTTEKDIDDVIFLNHTNPVTDTLETIDMLLDCIDLIL